MVKIHIFENMFWCFLKFQLLNSSKEKHYMVFNLYFLKFNFLCFSFFKKRLVFIFYFFIFVYVCDVHAFFCVCVMCMLTCYRTNWRSVPVRIPSLLWYLSYCLLFPDVMVLGGSTLKRSWRIKSMWCCSGTWVSFIYLLLIFDMM